MKGDLDVKITVSLSLVIFVCLLIVNGFENPKTLYSSGSQSVAITAFLRFIFVKWIWKKLPFLELFHGVPNLEGDWVGEYKSTYLDQETGTPKVGRIEVCISQPSIFDIIIRQKSGDSKSLSYTEELIVENDGNITLAFSYVLDPKATMRDRHQISYCSARYNLERNGDGVVLSGNYWTDQKSTGQVELKRRN